MSTFTECCGAKPIPAWKHGTIQMQFGRLIPIGECSTSSELTVRIDEEKYLVPDVGVQLREDVQEPYPTRPIFLCIEVLSPDDRFAGALAKCDDYLAWRTPMT